MFYSGHQVETLRAVREIDAKKMGEAKRLGLPEKKLPWFGTIKKKKKKDKE